MGCPKSSCRRDHTASVFGGDDLELSRWGTAGILLKKGLRAVGCGISSASQVVCEWGEQDMRCYSEKKKLFALIFLLVKCQISTGHSVPLQIQKNLKLSANRVSEMKLKDVKR